MIDMQNRALMIWALLLFFAAQPAFAQKPVLDTNPPPAMAPRLAVKENGTAKAFYTESKSETVAESGNVSMFKTDKEWGNIRAYFTSDGKGVKKPQNVILSIFIAANDRRFVDDLTFKVDVDEKNLFNGKSELADGRTNGRDIYSSLKISLPIKDFKELAKAKTIKLLIGTTTFNVALENVSNFSDLLGLIEK